MCLQSQTLHSKTAGDLDNQQNTVDPVHVALSVPHLAIPLQTTPQQNTYVQTALKNIMSSSKAASPTNLNRSLLPFASNMA